MTEAEKRAKSGKSDNDDQNPKWWDKPGYWLGIGIPLFIIAVVSLFLACRYYVGHPNDTPAFVAGVIGLLTLYAIVGQALIYKKQSDLMQGALKRTDNLISQNTSLITAARRQARATEKGLDLNEKMFYHTQRAYLGITTVGLKKFGEPAEKNTLPESGKFQIVIGVVNRGQTPAFGLAHAFRLGIGEPPLSVTPPDFGPTGRALTSLLPDSDPLVFEGDPIELPDADYKAITNGTKILVFSVKLDFECVGERQETFVTHYIWNPQKNAFGPRRDWPRFGFGDGD